MTVDLFYFDFRSCVVEIAVAFYEQFLWFPDEDSRWLMLSATRTSKQPPPWAILAIADTTIPAGGPATAVIPGLDTWLGTARSQPVRVPVLVGVATTIITGASLVTDLPVRHARGTSRLLAAGRPGLGGPEGVLVFAIPARRAQRADVSVVPLVADVLFPPPYQVLHGPDVSLVAEIDGYNVRHGVIEIRFLGK